MQKDKNNYLGEGEDKTKYGEVIPTMFSWMSLSDQKRRAEELNDMTKNRKKGRRN